MNCRNCKHYAPAAEECLELRGVYFCARCQKITGPGIVRCERCFELVNPSPIWEIKDPESPPSFCPGFTARDPPKMAEADDIQPTKKTKPKRRPKPDQGRLF